MQVTIPNADNFQVQRGLFIAAWKVWFKRFSELPLDWQEGRMPVGNSDKDLSELIESGQRFTLEVTCRLMVPWSYHNQEMASSQFILLNPALLRRVPYPTTDGETVDGVRLTEEVACVLRAMFFDYTESVNG